MSWLAVAAFLIERVNPWDCGGRSGDLFSIAADVVVGLDSLAGMCVLSQFRPCSCACEDMMVAMVRCVCGFLSGLNEGDSRHGRSFVQETCRHMHFGSRLWWDVAGACAGAHNIPWTSTSWYVRVRWGWVKVV